MEKHRRVAFMNSKKKGIGPTRGIKQGDPVKSLRGRTVCSTRTTTAGNLEELGDL